MENLREALNKYVGMIDENLAKAKEAIANDDTLRAELYLKTIEADGGIAAAAAKCLGLKKGVKILDDLNRRS